jgi:hypothetical protein
MVYFLTKDVLVPAECLQEQCIASPEKLLYCCMKMN